MNKSSDKQRELHVHDGLVNSTTALSKASVDDLRFSFSCRKFPSRKRALMTYFALFALHKLFGDEFSHGIVFLQRNQR